MKKYLLGVVIAGCMTGVDFSYAAEEHSETADTTEASSSDSSIDAYAGWYLGAGLSYQHTTGEALLSDNLGNLGGGINPSANGLSLIKTNVGRLGGGIVGGYGTFLDNTIYVGSEFTVDITGSKRNESEDRIYNLIQLKTNGFIPSVSFRLGFYSSKIDSLFYIKGGIAFLNSKFESNFFNESITNQRITPIIGIGIEKKVYSTCSIRIEGDYRITTEKEKCGLSAYVRGIRLPNYGASVKNKTHGYAIRMICVYHF